MEAIEIIMDKGCHPEKLYVNGSEVVDAESQFMARKVTTRTELRGILQLGKQWHLLDMKVGSEL